MGFKRTVKLPYEAILRELRYVNGILNAKLVRKTAHPTAS
jgi:HSP20 family molecular chaperone IbpA